MDRQTSGDRCDGGGDGDRSITDEEGMAWVLSEDALTAEDGRTLPRLPAHRAFWFGWYAAFPETRLVQ